MIIIIIIIIMIIIIITIIITMIIILIIIVTIIVIVHLFYRDDLKTYAKSDKDQKGLLQSSKASVMI